MAETRDALADAEGIIERASVEIARLCAGRGGITSDGRVGRSWTMCVPVQETDSDIVLCALLRLARQQREQLTAAREEIALDDKLLAERDAILDAYPCPEHGRCIPHVMDLLAASAKASQ